MFEVGLGQPSTGLIEVGVPLGITETDEVGSSPTWGKRLSRYTGHTGFL
jgi:hypothetical protein